MRDRQQDERMLERLERNWLDPDWQPLWAIKQPEVKERSRPHPKREQ